MLYKPKPSESRLAGHPRQAHCGQSSGSVQLGMSPFQVSAMECESAFKIIFDLITMVPVLPNTLQQPAETPQQLHWSL